MGWLTWQWAVDEVERLRALARAGQDPLHGPFRLGVIPTAGPYLLPLCSRINARLKWFLGQPKLR